MMGIKSVAWLYFGDKDDTEIELPFRRQKLLRGSEPQVIFPKTFTESIEGPMNLDEKIIISLISLTSNKFTISFNY